MGVSAVLASRGNREGYTEEDVRRVVANCPKQRFALLEEPGTGQLLIRANQGHTLKVSSDAQLWALMNNQAKKQ